MTSRERLTAIFAGETPDRNGFWLGMPHADTWPIYFEHFGVSDAEELRRLLGDDYRWICAQFNSYRHPEGKPVFQIVKTSHGSAGPFADCEDPQEVEDYPHWPDPDHLDFSDVLTTLENAGDYYRASGMWCCFYHNVMDYFGMENYMIKMHTHPEVVDAVTNKVCEFYYEANERFFEQAGDLVDGFFLGNDFGTQLDLICSPGHFDRYIMPWFRKFTDQGHRHGYQVILHSCGAVHKVIDRLVDAGVEALHPLQAKAADMDADSLARDFKGKIAFMGGVDTQDLLVNGTPEEVRADVHRVREILGPMVVSPSHEAILPNVPPENVRAMAEATVE